MDSYEIATKHGQMSLGEVDLLKDCAIKMSTDPIVVNIGAGFGTSAAAILESRPDAFIFSVDIQERPEELANIRACGLDESRVLRILSGSHRAGLNWPIFIDLLFVDGSHKEERVKEDISVWVPRLIPGGIVLFHDYKHRNVPWITPVVNDWARKANADQIGEERYLVAFRMPE